MQVAGIKSTTKTITKEENEKKKQWAHQMKEPRLMKMKEQTRMIPPTLYLVALRMFFLSLLNLLTSFLCITFKAIRAQYPKTTNIFAFSHSFLFFFFSVFHFILDYNVITMFYDDIFQMVYLSFILC